MGMPPNVQYARSGDVSIAYTVSGDGEHDIVVVPKGIPGEWRLYAVAGERP